jgi:hypothetical protein
VYSGRRGRLELLGVGSVEATVDDEFDVAFLRSLDAVDGEGEHWILAGRTSGQRPHFLSWRQCTRWPDPRVSTADYRELSSLDQRDAAEDCCCPTTSVSRA